MISQIRLQSIINFNSDFNSIVVIVVLQTEEEKEKLRKLEKMAEIKENEEKRLSEELKKVSAGKCSQ